MEIVVVRLLSNKSMDEKNSAFGSFFKKLKGKKIQFEAQIGYSAILNSRPNSNWRCVLENIRTEMATAGNFRGPAAAKSSKN